MARKVKEAARWRVCSSEAGEKIEMEHALALGQDAGCKVGSGRRCLRCDVT